MAPKIRAGKYSEVRVASELIKIGLDVYLPIVDDQAIDLIIRSKVKNKIIFFDVQVKSVKNYGRIIGFKPNENIKSNQLLIIHYRHEKKDDEFFYLTEEQIKLHSKGGRWGDVVINKNDRLTYTNQNIDGLLSYINTRS